MEQVREESADSRFADLRLEEVLHPKEVPIRELMELELQTFAEATFSPYAAHVFLQGGGVFVLRAGKDIIGTSVVVRRWDRPHDAQFLSTTLRPGWRGQGLGEYFLRGVLAKLEGRGIRQVSLLVASKNLAAIQAYQKVGFERTGEVVGEADYAGTFLRMTLSLKPPQVHEVLARSPGAADAEASEEE
jgi:ribosomal protein S18 acetylase RimI-like enzyme